MTHENMIFWEQEIPEKRKSEMVADCRQVADTIIKIMWSEFFEATYAHREYWRITEALLENDVEHIRLGRANLAALGGRLADHRADRGQGAAEGRSGLLGDLNEVRNVG